MAGKIENCRQVRKWMPDAAVGSLSAACRDDLDLHLRNCTSCQEEFQKMQRLLHAIDDGVSASIATGPSPQLVANIRQVIAQQAEDAHSLFWWQRHRWLMTTGACAALALMLFVVRVLVTPNRPIPTPAPQSLIASTEPPAVRVTPPSRAPAVESTKSATPPHSLSAVARRSSTLMSDSARSKVPEVIVEPGQMQAILHFATAMQRGQIDGAGFLADQRKMSEPLEIKPLAIAPLKIEPLNADAALPGSSNGEEPQKNFVAGRLD